MDLGKSKYGGPFSTEQVEDVKTIIHLLVISLPIWVLASSLFMHPRFVTRNVPGVPLCSTNFIIYFTYDDAWCVIVCTVIYEFVIYPIVRNRIPTILKRIGITSFLTIFISVVFLILELIQKFYTDNEAFIEGTKWITTVLYFTVKGSTALQLSLYTIGINLCTGSLQHEGTVCWLCDNYRIIITFPRRSD